MWDGALCRGLPAAQAARRREAGAGALPLVIDLRGVNQFHELNRLLGERVYRFARIEKVTDRNFVDYAERVRGSRGW